MPSNMAPEENMHRRLLKKLTQEFLYLYNMMEKKLFLLDSMALIYRAFYALNKTPWFNSKGLNTSAILGFANTLFDLLKNEKPTHIGAAFDTMAPTVRHEEFLEYKATRQETPEDLILSIPYIKAILEAFNVPVLEVDGYEADDVIGTLAKEAEKNGFLTYMMTSDKDFGQLVTEKTRIYKPSKMGDPPVIMGIKEVCEKFGIQRPAQVIDLLGLMGDTSDNIPGIPGVGEVTAKKLIAEFDNVENLIRQADQIKNPKLREKVLENTDKALFSKRLATIILDVPISFEEDQLIRQHPDPEKLQALFNELEFRNFGQRVFRWMEEEERSQKPEARSQKSEGSEVISDFTVQTQLPGLTPPSSILHPPTSNISNTPHQYHLINTVEKRAELITLLLESSSFCFDTETTGLDPNESELVGLSFSMKPGEAFYVPISENYHEACTILSEFKPPLEDEKKGKTGQNLKFDISILRWYDVEVKGPLFDTMLAHYLLQPDLRHNMDFLAETYLHYTPVSIEKLIGKKGSGQLSMRTVDIETICEYACEDADITLRLREVFEPMLVESGVMDLFGEIEIPLVPVLASMEAEGVRIDPGFLQEYAFQLEQEIRQVEKEIFSASGKTFNVASPRQLGEVLFDHLKIIENPKQTRTKQYSTSEDVLTKLVNKHPVVQMILDYRSLTKLKSTYVDVLPTLISQRDGRVHTSFNQTVAATGRLSSNNPNLQNIPIRTERGREIRKAFIPRNDRYILLSADYSQIELRIIASLSGDPSMINDFRQGLDIHTATAAKVYGISPDLVTKEMRRHAKTVNFGIIYGISAFGLSERLNIPRKEAASIIEQYFKQYPGIKAYMDETIRSAREKGYVETLMKRRRYLRDIHSQNSAVRGFAERNAINAPIQGSAADMIKIAMIRIHQEFQKQAFKSRMILQVHDELVFDVHQDELEMVKPIIETGMKNAIALQVPVEVEMNTGKNWLEAH